MQEGSTSMERYHMRVVVHQVLSRCYVQRYRPIFSAGCSFALRWSALLFQCATLSFPCICSCFSRTLFYPAAGDLVIFCWAFSFFFLTRKAGCGDPIPVDFSRLYQLKSDECRLCSWFKRKESLSFLPHLSLIQLEFSHKRLDSPIRILYFPWSFTCPVWWTLPPGLDEYSSLIWITETKALRSVVLPPSFLTRHSTDPAHQMITDLN